jgi:hypothetical protein
MEMCGAGEETSGVYKSQFCGGTSPGRNVQGKAEADGSQPVEKDGEASVRRYWCTLQSRNVFAPLKPSLPRPHTLGYAAARGHDRLCRRAKGVLKCLENSIVQGILRVFSFMYDRSNSCC